MYIFFRLLGYFRQHHFSLQIMHPVATQKKLQLSQKSKICHLLRSEFESHLTAGFITSMSSCFEYCNGCNEYRQLCIYACCIFREKYVPLTTRTLIRHLIQHKHSQNKESIDDFHQFAARLDSAVIKKYHGIFQDLKARILS